MRLSVQTSKSCAKLNLTKLAHWGAKKNTSMFSERSLAWIVNVLILMLQSSQFSSFLNCSINFFDFDILDLICEQTLKWPRPRKRWKSSRTKRGSSNLRMATRLSPAGELSLSTFAWRHLYSKVLMYTNFKGNYYKPATILLCILVVFQAYLWSRSFALETNLLTVKKF